jgi:hypothetical protein
MAANVSYTDADVSRRSEAHGWDRNLMGSSPEIFF